LRPDELYERVWSQKLGDPAWLAQDGRGRTEYAAAYLKSLGGSRSQRILDVGCGRGTLGRVLGDGCTLYGLDIACTAVLEAKKVYKSAHVVNLDEDEIPFPDGHFDVCVMLDVVEHLLDPISAAAKVCRALRPGGKVVLSAPNILWWRRIVALVLSRRFPKTGDDKYGYDGGHLHSFTFWDMAKILRKAGFSRVTNIGRRAGRILSDFRGAAIWICAERRC